jgi:hypothetical protein
MIQPVRARRLRGDSLRAPPVRETAASNLILEQAKNPEKQIHSLEQRLSI